MILGVGDFHLLLSQISQKPWCGWVGKHIWERSPKKNVFFYTFPYPILSLPQCNFFPQPAIVFQFPTFRALKTQLTFMTVGEPDYTNGCYQYSSLQKMSEILTSDWPSQLNFDQSGSFALGFFSKFNGQSHLPHWYTTSKISDFQSFSDFSNFYAWNHIVLYTIYMHQNRFITPFLTPIWKSDPHSPPDSTTSEIASYTISQIKLFEVDILLIWKRKILRKFGLNRSGETKAVKRV